MKKTSVLFILPLLLIAAGCSSVSRQPEQPDRRFDIVDVRSLDSSIVLDIRYATDNNFTKQVLYPVAKAKLRREAAESLASVQRELKQQGLGLKIYDGYRPLSIQWKLWEVVPDPNYVADPRKGSRHNRGAAVDLTIIDSLGNELEMPTQYDDFTEKAWHTFEDLPDAAKTNRALLKDVMTRHGFQPIQSEWWHYDFHGWEIFGIMDEPL
ncbi:MAG: M15 family metallopeptidase [Bacteroidota bacterium]